MLEDRDLESMMHVNVMSRERWEILYDPTPSRSLKRTSGEQLSLVADLIIEVGITKAPLIAGAMQRKQEHLKIWADAYTYYKGKRNQVNNIKKALGNRLTNAWDSWPGKVWRMTAERVQLVKEHIALKGWREAPVSLRDSGTLSGRNRRNEGDVGSPHGMYIYTYLKEKPKIKRAPFDMMSMAPNFDVQLDCATADHSAKTIVL